MWDSVSPKEVLKRCFGKEGPSPGDPTRRKSSADRRGWSSEIQETAYWKGQRLVVAFRKKRAGAHSGGNLRVRAFFISSFLSQE
jgi:hypothetical protein